MTNVTGDSADAAGPGVLGENSVNGDGVFGHGGSGGSGGRGAVGVSRDHTGVDGTTTKGIAVYGAATAGRGRGVVGVSNATTVRGGQRPNGDGVAQDEQAPADLIRVPAGGAQPAAISEHSSEKDQPFRLKVTSCSG